MGWSHRVPFNVSIGNAYPMALNGSSNVVVCPTDDTTFSKDVYEAQAHSAAATMGQGVGELIARWTKDPEYAAAKEARLGFPSYKDLNEAGQIYLVKLMVALAKCVSDKELDVEVEGAKDISAELEGENTILFFKD